MTALSIRKSEPRVLFLCRYPALRPVGPWLIDSLRPIRWAFAAVWRIGPLLALLGTEAGSEGWPVRDWKRKSAGQRDVLQVYEFTA